MKTIIVAGGGTGGHLFPAIAICEILQKASYRTYLITDQRCEAYLPTDLPFEHQIITVTRFNKNLKNFSNMFSKNIQAFKAVYELFKKEKPAIIIGCGGYTIIPLVVIAYFLKVKIVLHEQNAVVGKANSLFARIANKLFISFMHTVNLPRVESKIIWTGMPVTEKILSLNVKRRDSSTENFTILVIGGSQGAEIFDFIIPKAIKFLKSINPSLKIKIIQQIRTRPVEELKAIYDELNIESELASFFKDIDKKYTESHLLIGRSGSSTIAEIISCALPAIFIPYPIAKANHQLYNAMNLIDHKAAWYIEQKLLTPEKLGGLLNKLLMNPQLLLAASEKLRSLQVNTSKIITDEINKLIDKAE